MLELASITDPLVNFATDAVDAIGLPGVFLLMLLESACIPIPSEATMLFTGFNVSKGHYTLLEAVAVGSVGNLVGSWGAYAVGYYGRVGGVGKYRPNGGIRMHHLQAADRWFARQRGPRLSRGRLPLRRAPMLGGVQGPTESLPGSSSSHLALVPRLLGWPAAELAREVCKSLEVALHAGSAAALVLVIARERRPGSD